MKYPVGNGSKEDFYKNWYLADTFGTDRDTYFHNGVDINLRTGGDSDLGEPIIACLPGKLVYYHQASHPGSGYGIHHVYEVETPKGTRWIHNAHMQWIIHDQTELSEGQEIGAIGKSGTGYAHLHFSIFKVDPKTLDRGIDTIAKTRQQLSDWWEDPIAFLESLPSTLEPMKNELLEKYGVKDFEELDYKINEHCGTDWGGGRDSGYLGAEREKNKRLEAEKKGLEEEIGRLKADVTNYKTEAEQRKKELREFIEKLAKRLFLPAASDQSDILGGVDRLLEVEDQLTQAQKALSKKEQEFEKERVEMRAEIDELKSMLEKAHNRIDVLEQKMDQTEEQKDDFDWFKKLVEAISKIFQQ